MWRPIQQNLQISKLNEKFHLREDEHFSWKKDENCPAAVEHLTHPCELSTKYRREAESRCAVLRSETFRACHSQVSPEKAYENCLFDVCSCESSYPHCLCPILASYGDLCVERGVPVDWRLEVRECGLHCPAGQQYRQCADSCGHSCASISAATNCSSRCAEGCACPEGQTLSQSGDCVSVSSCPCLLRDSLHTAGSEDYRPETAEVCSCVSGRWVCQPASSQQLAEMTTKAAPVCDETQNRVLDSCHSGPVTTCANMHTDTTSTETCSLKCVCAPGFVENDDGVCIPFSSCPCHHGGKSYREGEQMKQRCNTW